ncbi:MAG: nucleoside triphosphate pyrophosphohydrolase [Bacteroidia bacterium]|nr:nucleoside triphosphate pyrophosphohydrolase [Bacteroidia bacterium]
MNEQLLPAFSRLFEVVHELREKCPWDKEQTRESLRHLTIEEVYELSDSILDDDWDEMKVELGDILLHVLFYSRIGEEENKFSTEEMITTLTEKLIRRHPHIYGDVQADSTDKVLRNWEEIKMAEKKNQKKKRVLDGVPNSMPSLIKALRIQEKVRNVGFDWDNPQDVWLKVQEELGEFKEEAEKGAAKEKLEDEFGDILFSLVNYARFIGINPDDALNRTNHKFKKRFEFIEEAIEKEGKNLKDLNLKEMDVYWEQAKKNAR